MKKFLATVALILALLVTTACLAEGIEFPLAESVTITAITHAPSFAPQDFSQRLIYKRLEENTNVVIDWTCYVDDQFGETKNLILSRKDLPDMVFDAQMGQYDVLRYADDGTIIAVDELIDNYMPNLKKVLDDYPEYRSLITAPDGHIYCFPWIEELGKGKEAIQAIGGIPYINQAWLAELGLDMPTTPDELTEVLRAFKAAKPDCLPLSFVMNGGNEDVCILLSAFGFGDNPDHYVVTNDKQVVYTLADEGIIPGLEWLHQLYEEGLIDPEVFTHDFNTYVSKAAGNRYGVYTAWDSNSAGTPTDYVALPALKNAETPWASTLAAPSSPAPTSIPRSPRRGSTSCMIRSSPCRPTGAPTATRPRTTSSSCWTTVRCRTCPSRTASCPTSCA